MTISLDLACSEGLVRMKADLHALVLTMHPFFPLAQRYSRRVVLPSGRSVREHVGQDMWVAETVLWSWTHLGTKPARSGIVDTAMWARLAFSPSVVLVLMCSVPFRRPSKVSRHHKRISSMCRGSSLHGAVYSSESSSANSSDKLNTPQLADHSRIVKSASVAFTNNSVL